MSEIKPIGYARKQDLLTYAKVWIGYEDPPAPENGHAPVPLYSSDQVSELLSRERERCACTIIQYDLPVFVVQSIRNLPDEVIK